MCIRDSSLPPSSFPPPAPPPPALEPGVGAGDEVAEPPWSFQSESYGPVAGYARSVLDFA
eukprot:2599259-Rhodomonas_salina.1